MVQTHTRHATTLQIAYVQLYFVQQPPTPALRHILTSDFQKPSALIIDSVKCVYV